MTDRDLEKINAERKRKGLPSLTKAQATEAISKRQPDDGFDTLGFLISYTTGIPMPSSGGILGSLLHPQQQDTRPANYESRHPTDEPKILDGGIDGPYNEPNPAYVSPSTPELSYAPAIEPSSNDSYSAPSSDSYSASSVDTSYSSPSFDSSSSF